jgi:hypothetical protein
MSSGETFTALNILMKSLDGMVEEILLPRQIAQIVFLDDQWLRGTLFTDARNVWFQIWCARHVVSNATACFLCIGLM